MTWPKRYSLDSQENGKWSVQLPIHCKLDLAGDVNGFAIIEPREGAKPSVNSPNDDQSASRQSEGYLYMLSRLTRQRWTTYPCGSCGEVHYLREESRAGKFMVRHPVTGSNRILGLDLGSAVAGAG